MGNALAAYCADNGLLLQPAGKDEYADIWLAEQRARLADRIAVGHHDGKPMQLEIGLVVDPEPNAWAATHDGTDLIAVNTGLGTMAEGLARTLLSLPLLFPEVGNPGLCEPRAMPESVRDILDATGRWDKRPLPCPEREEFVFLIVNGVLTHTIEHEFTHIFNGHLDLLAERMGLRRYAELGGEAAGLLRQTLEQDADSIATQNILCALLRFEDEEVGGRKRWKPVAPIELGDEKRAIQVIVLVASLFDAVTSRATGSDFPDCLAASHPPAIFRFGAHLQTVSRVLIEKAGMDRDVVWPMIHPVTAGLMISLRHVLPGIDWSAFGKIFDERFVELDNLYVEEWSRLHPDLDRLKRGGILSRPAAPRKPL